MSNNKKHLRTGVFIDGSNTFWAMKNIEPENQWHLGFDCLKRHFESKYKPVIFNYYGTTDDNPTSEKFRLHAEKEKKFHAALSGIGYNVITKPLKYIRNKSGGVITKGDMDVEITMGMNNALDDLDMIIIVSGDSDFLEAIKQFHAKGKYIRVYAFKHSLAWEVKEFVIKNTRCSYKYMDDMRDALEYKKEG